jgi:hypothetical protein
MGIVDEMYSANSTHITITSSAASPGPAVATPPRSASPVIGAEKRKSDRTSNEENMARRSSNDVARRGSAIGSGIDADQLQKVLREFDDAGKGRDTTPGGSPARKRQRVYGDRYEQIQEYAVKNKALTLIDSSRIEKARIYKPASACSMMKARQRPLPSRRSVHRMASFTSSEVSQR